MGSGPLLPGYGVSPIVKSQQKIHSSSDVSGLSQAAHSNWNSTDSGSLYKVFEQRKTWADAENYCQSFDSHLAVVDNEAKNNFIKELMKHARITEHIWIGLKTQSASSLPRVPYSNFNKESPIDGCAVIDKAGVWSIRPCEQLHPFVCQMILV
ncbi:hypothetical protein KIN20_006616 [Parelaphostrongylus tenuis]|uniref:C-type lectin domain-containing protein n=1 Tax=Parelaphostrongylus tenuis TaxID=148309 RepID=A0AAD5QL57_PARTN|nr:hypothetical protein KIN20_006616 [Parelaphostrongylus tenuis]